jgi:hypothetical protein
MPPLSEQQRWFEDPATGEPRFGVPPAADATDRGLSLAAAAEVNAATNVQNNNMVMVGGVQHGGGTASPQGDAALDKAVVRGHFDMDAQGTALFIQAAPTDGSSGAIVPSVPPAVTATQVVAATAAPSLLPEGAALPMAVASLAPAANAGGARVFDLASIAVELGDTTLPWARLDGAESDVSTVLHDERAVWTSLGFNEAPLINLLEAEGVLPFECAADAPRTAREAALAGGSNAYGQKTDAVVAAVISYISVVDAIAPCTDDAHAAPKRRLSLRNSAKDGPLSSRVKRASGASAAGNRAAAASEAEQREKAALAFADLLSLEQQGNMLSFGPGEFEDTPAERRRELILRHLCVFAPATVNGSRRALERLRDWCAAEGRELDGWRCSGGVLSCWVLDEQTRSRSSGGSVPAALRNGLVFAAKHACLPLQVDASVFKSVTVTESPPPKPAVSATWPIVVHLLFLASAAAATDVVRCYAAGFVLCALAALRMRDAQRASIISVADGVFSGRCYDSKHPKRRGRREMRFFAPVTGIGTGAAGDGWADTLAEHVGDRDYIFQKVRAVRGKPLSEACLLDAPARSADVVRFLRFLLTLPPLSMTKEDAAKISGHSLRHFLPTLARLFGLTEEDRCELARWAATQDKTHRRASMPNLYAQEAEAPRVIKIVSRLLEAARTAIGDTQLPPIGGWELIRAVQQEAAQAVAIDAEASSSESEDED